MQLRKTPENVSYEIIYEVCVTSHRLKWGSLPPNEVDRIAQQLREGEERKEGKDGEIKKKLSMFMLIKK